MTSYLNSLRSDGSIRRQRISYFVPGVAPSTVGCHVPGGLFVLCPLSVWVLSGTQSVFYPEFDPLPHHQSWFVSIPSPFSRRRRGKARFRISVWLPSSCGTTRFSPRLYHTAMNVSVLTHTAMDVSVRTHTTITVSAHVIQEVDHVQRKLTCYYNLTARDKGWFLKGDVFM